MGGALGGIQGTAYDTPVINDTSLVPASNKAAAAAESSMEAAKRQAKAAAERPFPTHVGDVDMIRIRTAEHAILEEEEIHGRMMRDEYGRLVPEAVRAAIDAANAAAADYPASMTQDHPLKVGRNLPVILELGFRKERRVLESLAVCWCH